MKAVTAITWKHILDWLAEAGSICSGMFIEYRNLGTAVPAAILGIGTSSFVETVGGQCRAERRGNPEFHLDYSYLLLTRPIGPGSPPRGPPGAL